MVEVVACRGAEVLSLEATCRLCGRREKGGRCVRAGSPLASPNQARTLLEMWSAREGEPDLRRFVASSFAGFDAAAVVSRLVRGATVPTTFDPLDWLFPESIQGDGGRPPAEPARTPTRPTRYCPVPPRPAGTAPAPARRTAPRALVAVMAGGGPIPPSRSGFLDRLLAAAGKPPLADAELRSWRPVELANPEDPGALLFVMACLAELEQPPEGAGKRVVRDFARAWSTPFPQLEARASELRQERGLGLVRLWYTARELLAAEPG